MVSQHAADRGTREGDPDAPDAAVREPDKDVEVRGCRDGDDECENIWLPEDALSRADTTAWQVASGLRDPQGIPWELTPYSRAEYRTIRLRQYNNYYNREEAVTAGRARLRAEAPAVDTSARLFAVAANRRQVNPSIVHFQLRNLLATPDSSGMYVVSDGRVLWHDAHGRLSATVLDGRSGAVGPDARPGALPTATDRIRGPVQLCTLAVDHGLVASGGFGGELLVAREDALAQGVKGPWDSDDDEDDDGDDDDDNDDGDERGSDSDGAGAGAATANDPWASTWRGAAGGLGPDAAQPFGAGGPRPRRLDPDSRAVRLGRRGGGRADDPWRPDGEGDGGRGGAWGTQRPVTAATGAATRPRRGHARRPPVPPPPLVCARRITSSENGITNALDISAGPSGAPRIVASNNDDTVRVLDSGRCEVLVSHSLPWAINATVARPGRPSRLLASVGDDPAAVLYDGDSPGGASRPVARLEGHLDFSFAASWHPAGDLIATGNQDCTTRVYDVRRPDRTLALLPAVAGAIRNLRFSPCGRFLVAAEPSDYVTIYDVQSGFSRAQVIDVFGEVAGVAFTPETSRLTVAIADVHYASALQLDRCMAKPLWDDLF